jgi:hypothetical protein
MERAALSYLFNGDTGGDPRWDRLANRRAEILSAPPAAQPALARKYADDVIAACETAADAADQAQARQAEAARWNAEHEAKLARIAARFKSTCAKRHGTYSESNAVGNLCTVSFKDAQDQVVPIDDNGDWDAQQAAANREDCSLAQQDSDAADKDGSPWSVKPTYHPDMGVCDRGQP